ncbi:Uncharacterised protein [Parabacteroides distasonis]|uniref:Uncharacterized protein n=1 Tax=Parabacteroides distasonis TaxID=823 RepID=A0A173S3R0_PARDI|nr:Uncharacterised protein [Parabacteroides distasonis]
MPRKALYRYTTDSNSSSTALFKPIWASSKPRWASNTSM